jgi:sulfite dehydrogenase (quinone) subunit SoeC
LQKLLEQMHPALSIIIFTVSSGAGYGLLAFTGVFAAARLLPGERWFGVTAVTFSLAAIALGLVASTRHLGHPERAWRAFSQWRSSWLSREGVAALATFVPGGLLWLALLAGIEGWPLALLGLATAVLAMVTVGCTAMIYGSLRAIRQWHHPLVVPGYFALALMTGALWFAALSTLWIGKAHFAAAIALVAIALAVIVKLAYWSSLASGAPPATVESATGLGGNGPVRLFEAPHTTENFLLKEMGFAIARRHATRLRRIALAAGFALPFLLTMVALFSSLLAAPAAILAALFGTGGVLVERWLFFAEAKHTVTLYYGASAV